MRSDRCKDIIPGRPSPRAIRIHMTKIPSPFLDGQQQVTWTYSWKPLTSVHLQQSSGERGIALQIPVCPLVNCISLGKLFNYSESWFLCFINGDHYSFYLIEVVVRIDWYNLLEGLSTVCAYSKCSVHISCHLGPASSSVLKSPTCWLPCVKSLESLFFLAVVLKAVPEII